MQIHQRVFAFDDPVEFLNFELRERQKRNPRFSLRAWSRSVGYENPSYLSHVLNRKRRLKPELASKLANDLALSGRPLRYFELIVLNHSAQSETERENFSKQIKSVRPKRYEQVNRLSLETFSVISDWYHWAILEMTDLNDFDSSYSSIHKRLGGRVDLKTVKAAVERLLRSGLIVRDSQGRLHRSHDGNNETDAPVPPEAVLSYHRQMGLLGVEAVRDQAHGERDFYGSTLSFKKSNYKRAQEIIAEAHRQLLRLAEHGTGEEVYQFNTQFFRLTGPRKNRR